MANTVGEVCGLLPGDMDGYILSSGHTVSAIHAAVGHTYLLRYPEMGEHCPRMHVEVDPFFFFWLFAKDVGKA